MSAHPIRSAAHVVDETDVVGVSLSEDALAIQFARLYQKQLKWTPGMGWMINKGIHWARDEKLERFQAAREVCRQAAIAAPDSREGKRLSSAKTVASVLTLAQSDKAIVLPAAAWDADIAVLNTGDEVVDLRTGLSVARGGHFFTQVTRVPRATIPHPTWTRFLQSIFEGDLEMIDFIQRMLGYMLTADRREQALFFFYGFGSNGKSTLVDTVKWIMGSYGIKLSASVLMQSHVDRHPTELAQLLNVRLAVSSELDEGQCWAESRIKELTGDEVLSARYMRQDFIEFPMTQKHLIVGNYKPRLRGGDAALARRFVLVPFNAKFEGSSRDPNMIAKLRGEASGILSWAIEGATRWYRSGLAIPPSIRAASMEYLGDNDDVALWIEEVCHLEPNTRTKASDLYQSFSDWTRLRGQVVPSMRLFGERLTAMPGIGKIQSNGIRYVGIRFRQADIDRPSSTPQSQLQRVGNGCTDG